MGMPLLLWGDYMIKVNGVTLKTPSIFTWDITDLSSEESGRSINTGEAIKDIIATKRSLSCTWNNLTKAEVSTILKAVTGKPFMEVTYPDSLSGSNETRKFYVGDRTTPMYSNIRGLYSSLSFTFIEK